MKKIGIGENIGNRQDKIYLWIINCRYRIVYECFKDGSLIENQLV